VAIALVLVCFLCAYLMIRNHNLSLKLEESPSYAELRLVNRALRYASLHDALIEESDDDRGSDLFSALLEAEDELFDQCDVVAEHRGIKLTGAVQ